MLPGIIHTRVTNTYIIEQIPPRILTSRGIPGPAQAVEASGSWLRDAEHLHGWIMAHDS